MNHPEFQLRTATGKAPIQRGSPWFLLALATIALIAFTTASRAQSLCDSYHVPANHLGNVEGCLFDLDSNLTTITFKAPAILQWNDGFNIGSAQHLRFAFPGIDNGAVLNRDLSGGNSNIAGTITSDGRVMLINPGGVISIQQSGSIDADGGFLASTLDNPDDEALLSGADTEFQGSKFSAIDNRGTIRSARGDIILISGSVNNIDSGRIVAASGGVHIGAGTNIRLATIGEPRITVLDGAGQHGIRNQGSIAAATTVDLSAYAPEPIAPGDRNPAIANDGLIRVTSQGGRVFLRALPGNSQVLNSADGTIESPNLNIEGEFINLGAVIDPDDGANPGAPTGTRQFPRLTSSALTQTANSDFRLSRLSFSHLNGLESKTAKRPKKTASKKSTTTTIAATTRGASEASKRKSSTASGQGKKIVLRRGAFFGKKTK